MPGRKHLRGVSPKEQRQYEHINQRLRSVPAVMAVESRKWRLERAQAAQGQGTWQGTVSLPSQ